MAASFPHYPPGFYGKKPSPNTSFWMRSQNNEPELDYNNVRYYICENESTATMEVPVDILRIVVGNPGGYWPLKFDNLVMVNKAGEIAPAHLPNYHDVLVFSNVKATVELLNKQKGKVKYSGVTPFIPKLMLEMIDPVPNITTRGPIYELGIGVYNTQMGCGSDGMQIMQVRRPISSIGVMIVKNRVVEEYPVGRFWNIRLTTVFTSGKPCMPLGASLIIWSALRITRPSFYRHYRHVMEVHNPAAIIITEARVQNITCKHVMEKIGTHMKWVLDTSEGLLGGALVLWDPARVESTFMISQPKIVPVRMRGIIAAT